MQIFRPASRAGEFSLPFQLLLAVVVLLVVVGVVLAVTNPQIFSFSEASNATIFATMKNLGDLVTP